LFISTRQRNHLDCFFFIYIYIYIYKRVIELSYGGKIYFVNESFMMKTYFFISSMLSEEKLLQHNIRGWNYIKKNSIIKNKELFKEQSN